MPYRQRPLFYWQKILRLVKCFFPINPKLIFTAAGLLTIGVLLLWAVVGSIRQHDMAINVPQEPVQMEKQQTQPDKTVLQAVEPVLEIQEYTKNEAEKPQVPVWPIKGQTTRGVGWYENLVFKEWRYHAGYDITGTEGQAVKAALGGEVTDIFNGTNSGLTAVVKDQQYVMYYGSLASITVKKGDIVTAGTQIGTIGSFAAEPFPHLHLSIKRGDKSIDPYEIIKE